MRHQRVDRETASRFVKEYLATFDDAAFGCWERCSSKFVSPSDPAAQSAGATRGPEFFAQGCAARSLSRSRANRALRPSHGLYPQQGARASDRSTPRCAGARDRSLLVGVRCDQVRIDREAFAADQTRCDARLHNALEHAAEDVAIAQALVAGRQSNGPAPRMLRHGWMPCECTNRPMFVHCINDIHPPGRMATNEAETLMREFWPL